MSRSSNQCAAWVYLCKTLCETSREVRRMLPYLNFRDFFMRFCGLILGNIAIGIQSRVLVIMSLEVCSRNVCAQ